LALELYFNKNKQYPVNLPDLVPNYLPSVPTPPEGGSYGYFPLSKTVSAAGCFLNKTCRCYSYQIWTTFEQKNSNLESKKGFDSSSLSGPFECDSGHTGINASVPGSLIYDAMP
ncbi:MAG: hypothetical protein WCG60_02705, partial [bacterium]